jgi:hypothetical protein
MTKFTCDQSDMTFQGTVDRSTIEPELLEGNTEPSDDGEGLQGFLSDLTGEEVL